MIDPGFLEEMMSRRNFQCTYSKLKSEMACDKESKRQQPVYKLGASPQPVESLPSRASGSNDKVVRLEWWNTGILEKWALIALRVPRCVLRVKGFVLGI